MPNCPALLLLFLATARSGEEVHLLDPSWPSGTLEAVVARLPNPLIVSGDEGCALRHRGIFIDPRSLFGSVADNFGAPPVFDDVAEPAATKAFYVGFTSGSTGLPKGYRRTHASWLDGYEGEVAEFGINAGDVVLVPGPMAHSLAPYAIVRALNAGARVIFCSHFTPKSAWSILEAEKVTVLYCVPTHLKMLMNWAERSQQSPLGHVRLIFSTGAKWPANGGEDLKRTFPAAEFCEFYGTSELGYLTLAKSSENIPANSVGRPFPGVHIKICDESGTELAPGQPGLVYAESPLVFMSYAYGAEGTERRLGDAVSAGDVGYLGPDGLLYLIGRADRMIINSGKNIHPEEIEEVLQHHPSIHNAAILPTADDVRGQRLVAVLKLNEGQFATRAEIFAFSRERLSLYKVPRRYLVLAEWPTTQAGKTDFAKLLMLISAGTCETLT